MTETNKVFITLALYVTTIFFSSCGQPSLQKKVLIIGTDGMRPDIIQKIEMPNLDKLISEGSVSFNALNVNDGIEPDFNGHSATNWASLLTGMSPSSHGITKNDPDFHYIDDDYSNPNLNDFDDKRRVRTIFGILKDYDSTAQTLVVNTWGGIGMGEKSILEYSQNVVDFQFSATSPPDNRIRDTINTQVVVDILIKKDKDLKIDPDLIYLHLGQSDTHATVVNSMGEYTENAVTRYKNIDKLIGKLVDALKARETYDMEDWLVIVCSDHGATDEGEHGGTSKIERTIPFIVSGKSALKNANLNTPRIWDVATTSLTHLGVNISEYRMDGKCVGIKE